MIKKRGKYPLIYLHPGEYRFSENPEVITTVLGSCVSVTMHVKRLKLGAIFHAVLPDNKGKADQTSKDINDFKYVDGSIYNLLELFGRYDVDRKEIEIKVFGGADVLRKSNLRENSISVGAQNVNSALKILSEEGLKISASDLGGNQGRKLFFFTHTGDIYMKYLRKIKQADLPSEK